MHGLFSARMVGAHLVTLAALAAAAGLGWWQVDTWQAKRDLEQQDLTTAPAVPLTEMLDPDETMTADQVGRPIEMSGTWLPESTVLISERPNGDRDGYWVVTALTTGEADDPALPVVRGWIAEPEDAPPAPVGVAGITAWLQPPEGTGATDRDPSDDVLPQLRVADLIQRVDNDLYAAFGVAEVPEMELAPATLDQLPPVGRFTAWRSLLYAIEWWVFGGFAVLIWWRFVREERRTAEPVASPT